jgi:hypothetical protein
LAVGPEAGILLTIAFRTTVRYLLLVIEFGRDAPFENKKLYLSYMDIAIGFVKVILYAFFMAFTFTGNGMFCLLAIRPLYLTLKSLIESSNFVYRAFTEGGLP